MDREEFERIKQAEKEHLRKLKAIKGQLKEARRTSKLRQAIEGITGALGSQEFDTSLDDVQREALTSEAKLDMALDSATASSGPPVKSEQEMREAEAAALVAQMKAALEPGLPPEPEALAAASDHTDSDDDGLPEKTIGRLKPSADPTEEELPEKTIGRIRRPKPEA